MRLKYISILNSEIVEKESFYPNFLSILVMKIRYGRIKLLINSNSYITTAYGNNPNDRKVIFIYDKHKVKHAQK